MAMDRRRYVPSPEGLEGRALQASLFGQTTPATGLTNTIDTLPENFKQKELRIAHLPFFLNQLQPGRFLPTATVQSIQSDLQGVVGRLHAPSKTSADGFNLDLRHLFPDNHLRADNAKILRHAFQSILVSAGTPLPQIDAFLNDMNQLARVDARSIEGSQLAAQDYALVVQTTLAVGRPILTPSAPTLALTDGTRLANGAAGVTRKPHPTLVGTYTEGATKEGSTTMQIVDMAGDVLGAAPVDANGKYSVQVVPPLSPGKYKLEVRAIEPLGLVSMPSKPFVLKVAEPRPKPTPAAETLTPPAGPLNLNP